MKVCTVCGKNLLMYEAFECDFCHLIFCAEHRLAENHNCNSAPKRTPLGHWKAKPDFDDYVIESKVLGITKVKPKEKKLSFKEKFKRFFKKKKKEIFS